MQKKVVSDEADRPGLIAFAWTHIAIIEAHQGFEGFPVVHWCTSKEHAEKFITTWMRENDKTRPYARYTIAECLYVVEG